MLSDEETKEIKEKLISHIESSFPEEQKWNAIQQIESMNSEQLENFLRRNKIMKEENSGKQEQGECVFCSIASDKIKSVKIGENKDAVAVLEINPISKGHFIVIPRKHSGKVPKSAALLASKLSKLVKQKFSPKTMEISTSKMFGHEIINVLPVYGKENFDSEKKPARIEELERTKEELEKKTTKIKGVVNKKEKTEEVRNFWLPKRIP